MLKKLKQLKWHKIIKRSGLFDVKYYLFAYPDIRKAEIDPIMHYIKFGVAEGRNPSREFNTNFYLNKNEDVKISGINPLVHYVLSGKDEGRETTIKKVTASIKSNTIKPIKKEKIIVVSHDAYPHGGQYLALNIGRALSENFNYEVEFILRKTGILIEEFEKVGNVHHIYNMTDKEQQKLYLELYKKGFVKAIANTSVVGDVVEGLVDAKINVISLIHEMSQTIKTMNLFSSLNQIYKKADLVVLPNKIVKNDIKNIFDIDEEKTEISPQGLFRINPYRFKKSEARDKLCNELGIGLNSQIVLNIAYADYRKGLDLFAEIASKVIDTLQDVHFVWVGDNAPDLMEEIKSKFITNTNKVNLHFVGHQTEIEHYYAGSDLFLLTSREDPFPSVVLDAMNCALPVVGFKNCGGFEEIIYDKELLLNIDDIDTSVNFLINFLGSDKAKRIGEKNQNLIDTSFSFNNYIFKLLDFLKEDVKKVTVIVPCFNHEKYIKERLESILNQSYPIYEIIFLDDKSSDNSVKVAKEVISRTTIPYKIIVNEKNSGSPFKQWKKGIELAKGDIIWIAEGDDSCSNNFLSTLTPYFDDKFVNIAYAKTEMMNEKSAISLGVFDEYLNDAYPDKFSKNYIKTGNEEINDQLGALNTLINASGLLIRKSSFGKNLDAAQRYKMCGDWLIYIECLKNGKIAYDINATNYFRRHSASQVAKTEGSEAYFRERKEISEYVFSNFQLSDTLKNKTFVIMEKEWERYKNKHPNKQLRDFYNTSELLEIVEKRVQIPSLAVIASDFSPGGGQLFAIRLANAWKKMGGNVILLNVDKHPKNSEVIKKIDIDVPWYDVQDINFEEIVAVFGIDIIHSSIWWADKYVFENINSVKSKIKWVLTMHGCYESLLENPKWDGEFLKYVPKMLREVDEWVYTAEKNKKLFEIYGYPTNLTKVFNGYEPEIPVKVERSSLGINEDSLILCLASRALESKGWYDAVKVVNRLNKKGFKIDLLLIGEGDVANDLKNQHQDKKYIHFLGQVSNLADFIALSDIGILPTTFIGESMPLVLIEFMAQGKPIISTDIGEIKSMMQDEHGSAGLILKVEKNKINSKLFTNAIVNLYNEKEKIVEFSKNSKRLFEKFKMDTMINEYRKIYK